MNEVYNSVDRRQNISIQFNDSTANIFWLILYAGTVSWLVDDIFTRHILGRTNLTHMCRHIQQ